MSVTLSTKLRQGGKANALRREGFIPAVVYGPTTESMSISIDQRELRAVFSRITRSSLIDLKISDHGEEKEFEVFVKRIQYNPVTDEPIHVDFYHPDTKSPLKLHVPLKIVGDAPGLKAGGVLNILFDTVRVHGLAKDIPHLITLDISELDLGDVIRVRDIDFGKVTPLLSPERALVTIMVPRGVGIEVEEEVEGEVEGEMLETLEGEVEGEEIEATVGGEEPAEGE